MSTYNPRPVNVTALYLYIVLDDQPQSVLDTGGLGCLLTLLETALLKMHSMSKYGESLFHNITATR